MYLGLIMAIPTVSTYSNIYSSKWKIHQTDEPIRVSLFVLMKLYLECPKSAALLRLLTSGPSHVRRDTHNKK